MRLSTLLLVLLLSSPCLAQITVSGDVSGIWGEQDSIYQVVGDVTVPDGQYLTILPGVEVQFMGDYKFTVLGGLYAQGTYEDSVKFVSVFGYWPGAWQYIEFNGVNPGEAVLAYCLIESGERAVYVENCQVTISNCLIHGHELSPVKGEDAQIFLNDCIITQNGGSGLSLQNTSATVIDCEITYHNDLYPSGRGINASGSGNITVTGGYIGHNEDNGINCYETSTITLESVEIAENGYDGVSLTNCTMMIASRVSIHNNESDGIFISSNAVTSLIAHNLTVSNNGNRGIFGYNSVMQITSSIMDRNGYYGVYVSSGSAYLSHNDAYLNEDGNYFNCIPGEGSIEEDPLYVSLPGMDFNLQEGSPCIDAGSPSDPLDPDGTVTDMGAYYYDQTPVLPRTEPETPSQFKIVELYPNPFNPTLNIAVSAAAPATGIIEAWTISGRLAARIWQGRLQPGINKFSWCADSFASGIYYISVRSGGVTDIKPSVLLK